MTEHYLPASLLRLLDLFRRKFKGASAGTLASDARAFAAASRDGGPAPSSLLPDQLNKPVTTWMTRQFDDNTMRTPPARWIPLNAVDHLGATYKPRKRSRGDSLVLIGTHDDWKPAQIFRIFTINLYPTGHRQTFTLLQIRLFPELSLADAGNDRYRKFHSAGRIYYNPDGDQTEQGVSQKPKSRIPDGLPKVVPMKTEEEFLNTEIIGIEELLCHFAMTPAVSKEISRSHIHVLQIDRVRPEVLCFETPI